MRRVQSKPHRSVRPASRVTGLALLALAFASLQASAQEATDPSAPAAPAAPPAEAGPSWIPSPERVIEKRSGDYSFRLTLQPGDLRVGKPGAAVVEIIRLLEIPDPVTGYQRPVRDVQPVAVVVPPPPAAPAAPAKGRPAAAPAPYPTVRARMWALTNPGAYGFQFTPPADGLYTLTVTGAEPRPEGGERTFEVTFTIGAGSAAGQTEQGQGSSANRRGARRPVGPGTAQRAAEDRLQRLMEAIGDGFLALEAAAAQGPKGDASAEAKALAALLREAQAHVPAEADATEFRSLAAAAAERIEATIEAGARKGATLTGAVAEAERAACQQCHVKYRWRVTRDIGSFPWK